MKNKQRGGFGLGLITGLLLGLALALGVALYVTKVPIPFVNKVPPRVVERDADERERNRNWDPNSPLHGSNPARPGATPATPPTSPRQPAAATADKAPAADPADPPSDVAQTAPPRDPAQPNASTAAAPNAAGTGSADAKREAVAIFSDRPPAGDGALSTRPRDDPFIYFVQAGAFGRAEDAEQQRARLAMLGMEAKVTEREQAGRTVYRVRVGPFDKRERADETKTRLASASVEGVLVRVQK
jgi:cell division protein FtsN